MVEDADSISDLSFRERLYSRLQEWRKLIQLAFAMEMTMLVFTLLALVLLDTTTGGFVLLTMNIAVLVPVLALTYAILYFVEPLAKSPDEEGA